LFESETFDYFNRYKKVTLFILEAFFHLQCKQSISSRSKDKKINTGANKKKRGGKDF
jgi:hypothetical protein